MSCTNPECDGHGTLRDGPWGSNAPCLVCNPDLAKATKEDVDQLRKALEAGGYDAAPAATEVKMETIDTSYWTEFGDFFDRPLSNSLLWLFDEVLPSQQKVRRVIPCGFISVVSTDKEKAVAELRAELFKLRQSPAIIKAYLAKPSTIELVLPLENGETSDTTSYVDLRGPVPAKKGWAAFCFLHGFTVENPGAAPYPEYRPLDKTNLDRFLTSAILEGEVGRRI